MLLDSWIFLTFLSTSLMSFNFIFNKIMLTKYFPDSVSYLIFTLISDIIYLIPIPFFIPILVPPIWLLATLAVGIVFSLAFYFQNRAFQTEDATTVSVLSRTSPLFYIVLAIMLLNEILTPLHYLGAFLLIASGVVISLKPAKLNQVAISSAVKPIFIFNTILAFMGVARKYLLFHASYWAVFYWMSVGGILGSLFLLVSKPIRRRYLNLQKQLPLSGYLIRLLSVGIYVIGTIAYNKALQIGTLSGVSSIYATQPLFVVFYAYLFTLIAPHIIKEDFSKTTGLQKLSAALLVLLGATLIAK